MSDHAERFWSKVAVGDPDECWEWQACRNRGYGQFGIGPRGPGRLRYAHRVAYELVVGPIPTDMFIDHLCRNRACVNPSHMEVVSGRENTLRGESFAAVNAKKTHCPSGHDLSTDIRVWRGRRVCKECRRQLSRRRRAEGKT